MSDGLSVVGDQIYRTSLRRTAAPPGYLCRANKRVGSLGLRFAYGAHQRRQHRAARDNITGGSASRSRYGRE